MSVSLIKTAFTAAAAGCYLEGAHGWHNAYRVIELAQAHGFPLSHRDGELVDAYRDGVEVDGEGVDTLDAVHDIGDEALAFLNERTDDSAVWEWVDGELFLSPTACHMSVVYGGERWCDTHDSAAPCPIGGGE